MCLQLGWAGLLLAAVLLQLSPTQPPTITEWGRGCRAPIGAELLHFHTGAEALWGRARIASLADLMMMMMIRGGGGWCEDYKPRQLPRSALPLPLLSAAPRRQRAAHAWPRHELRSGAMMGGGWGWEDGGLQCVIRGGGSAGEASRSRSTQGLHTVFFLAVAVCTEPRARLSRQVASLLRFALFSFSLLPFPIPQLCPQLHGRIPAVGTFTPCKEMQPGTVRCSAQDAGRRGVEFASSTFGFPLESAGEQSTERSPGGRCACKAPRSLQKKDALVAIQHLRVNKAPWFGAKAGTAAALRRVCTATPHPQTAVCKLVVQL